MDSKAKIPDKLLWVDLEMTGLDPAADVILEIAAEITDFNLKTLDSYEARIKQSRKTVINRIQKNTWWQGYSENRDQFIKGLDEGIAIKTAENQMLELVEKHFGSNPVILAGNSIYNDRNFIKKSMPNLELKLHYRMLDVSAWKVLMQGRYGLIYQKPETHRAYDDIQASIAELEHYIDYFNKTG